MMMMMICFVAAASRSASDDADKSVVVERILTSSGDRDYDTAIERIVLLRRTFLCVQESSCLDAAMALCRAVHASFVRLLACAADQRCV